MTPVHVQVAMKSPIVARNKRLSAGKLKTKSPSLCPGLWLYKNKPSDPCQQ